MYLVSNIFLFFLLFFSIADSLLDENAYCTQKKNFFFDSSSQLKYFGLLIFINHLFANFLFLGY